MNRITVIGVVLAVLGIISLFADCPYGVHIIIAGVVVALIGYFTRASRHTATGV